MTREEIIRELRNLLRQQQHIKVDADAITTDMRFDQIGFDSLSVLDFMYDVEERFDTLPEMDQLVKMRKVSDLIDYLEVHAK